MSRFGQKIAVALLPLSLVALLMSTGEIYAAEFDNKAARIKIAMLYNVLKFVTWQNSGSADDSGDITIGAIGTGELNSHLSILDGKALGRKRIKVIELSPGKDWPENFNVLSVGLVEKGEYAKLIQWEKRQGILTVSDLKDFAITGGIIGFVLDDRGVKFDINLDAAKANELIISSKLAALARNVIQDGKTRAFR